LEIDDPKAAARVFQAIVSNDVSRYENCLSVAQAFINKDAYDEAIRFLDPIIPTLISQQETERAAGLYQLILQRRPQYIPALTKLESLYSAAGEPARCLEAMDEIANCFLCEKRPVEALEYLEKILQANPESEKHRELHHQAFTEAYPDTPYIPPVEPPQSSIAGEPFMIEKDSVAIDLLDVFGSDDGQSTAREAIESQTLPEAMQQAPDASRGAYSKSVKEQLQEVDFYIQLGFNGEALGKLNEIAKANPNHPELASRYEKIGDADTIVQESIVLKDSAQSLPQFPKESAAESFEDIQFSEFDSILDSDQDNRIETIPDGKASESLRNSTPSSTEPAPQHAEPSRNPLPSEPAGTHVIMNDMFADLMEEVATIDREEVMAVFEEHFSLGTAYRDMDLIEDAIKEFETALKAIDMQKGDPRVIQCCGMLSTCFLKKNMPHSAMRWCQTGLAIADISSHEAMAFRYDMGIAHSMAGSKEEALECFNRIFSADPGYRDVAQRMDELRSGFERHAS
jgi:tetratricopeptide (TPR) repeat protein